MCLEVSIIRCISLPRIGSQSYYHSNYNSQDNDKICGIVWMKAFEQYMFIYVCFYFLFLVDPLCQKLNELKNFNFWYPLFNHLWNWKFFIRITRKRVQRLFEWVFFGNEQVQMLMIIQHIFEDNFVAIHQFIWMVDWFEIIKFFLQANILYFFSCLFFLKLLAIVVDVSHITNQK